MNKKQYITVGLTILLFVGIIIVILISNNKDNWTTEIINSEKYEVLMDSCNNEKKTLPNEVLQEISKNWNELSNNGPWMGNNSICYEKVIISYEKDNIIQEVEIQLIDDTSLVLNINDNSTYYTKSTHINNYLNSLFNDN